VDFYAGEYQENEAVLDERRAVDSASKVLAAPRMAERIPAEQGKSKYAE
jgi:hypothetical protein